MKICVFGSASNAIDNSYITAVEALGEEMARRGHTLVFGAGAHGLMGAAARGVHKGNGKILGVIPHFFREENVECIYDKCTELIYTDTMSERKAKMEDLADAFIITPGGVGTFEEFFEVFTLKQLGRHTKPIAVLNINNYYDKLSEFLLVSVKENFIHENCKELCFTSKSIDEVLEYIESDDREKRDVQELKFG